MIKNKLATNVIAARDAWWMKNYQQRAGHHMRVPSYKPVDYSVKALENKQTPPLSLAMSLLKLLYSSISSILNPQIVAR